MSTKNKLIEIPCGQWPQLRDLYKQDWPKHHAAYYTIQNYIDWFKNDPQIKNIKVYSLNGDWNDGTYLIIDRYNALFCTLDDNPERLITALGLLDKTKYYNLFGFVERLLPAVQNFFKINEWSFDTTGSETVWHYMRKEDARNFDVTPPTGICLKPLSEEHAQIANELWPHRHPGSLTFLKHLVQYNPSVGAFDEKTGELIAWSFRLPIGSLGILQVKDSHMRQGIGSLIVKAMSKLFVDAGYDVCAPVVEANTPSRNMFRKLGFEEFGKTYWIVTKPNDPSYMWNEKDDE